jgi:hypothetical protein
LIVPTLNLTRLTGQLVNAVHIGVVAAHPGQGRANAPVSGLGASRNPPVVKNNRDGKPL